MARREDLVSYLLDTLAVGGVAAAGGCYAARAMFGGHGLYRDGLMFAIVMDGVVYVKADAQSRARFEGRGLPPFTYRSRGEERTLSYCRVPDEAIDAAEALAEWAGIGYEAALRASARARGRGRERGRGTVRRSERRRAARAGVLPPERPSSGRGGTTSSVRAGAGRTRRGLTTKRLRLRRPSAADAAAIFTRFASDAEVTRYVSWPRHRSIDDTQAYLALAEAEWARWPAGALLIESREDGALLGSTGLHFETAERAATGCVLARDAWGRGHATEAVGAIARLAESLGVRRLYALSHVDHRASARMLEKAGFELEGTWRRHAVFPNLAADVPADVLCFVRLC